MRTSLLLLLTTCTMCTGLSEKQPETLFRQRIPNSSLVIYRFSFASDYAFTDEYRGLCVLDSSLEFSRSQITELPCSYFMHQPSPRSLDMLKIDFGQSPRTEKDTLLTPVKKYSQKTGELQINVIEYNDTYGSATTSTGLMDYQFSRLQETDDSLIFYNVKRNFGGKRFSARTAFAKGNITVMEQADGTIHRVEVEQAVIRRGEIYKPNKPLELVPDRPVVGMATYWFHPNTPIKSATLSDYGIFKRVR